MESVKRNALGHGLEAALEAAEAALPNAYCPHSGLQVAAALTLADGKIVTGVNYESDSYGLTLCAERTALARAQVKGLIDGSHALVVVARWKSVSTAPIPLTPCGACRQWLAELSHRLGRDLPVYSFWSGAESGIQTSALALMPGAFSLDP
jgi:homotetrameric cytidine deaminase